jgi:hypothetical protein
MTKGIRSPDMKELGVHTGQPKKAKKEQEQSV